MKNSCPICNSISIKSFLRREKVPAFQNLLIKDREATTRIAYGELNLAVCSECGFIFNQTFDPVKLIYGEYYENTQSCSPLFNEYLEELARYLVWEKSVRNCRILEIGCGKGIFLRKLVEIENSGNIGYGFDPSYIGPEEDLDGRLNFKKCYYDENSSNIPVDVVICRHVIEHVPEPLGVLLNLRKNLANCTGAKVFFETPCAQWILENRVFWDFFYEHCSYFTTGSLTTAFETSGFQVEAIRHVFGGQYMWLEAAMPESPPLVTKDPGTISVLALDFAPSEAELITAWVKRIQELSAHGPIALWGAGAKGVTFLNLIDPERQRIACVIDINPNKQGHFIPGTGHPIVNYDEIPH